MIVITDKVTCCGCWACENICPKHCVVMKEDNEGFRYPEVDVEVCIECGLCEAVCPILHKPIKEHEETIGYVIQHTLSACPEKIPHEKKQNRIKPEKNFAARIVLGKKYVTVDV